MDYWRLSDELTIEQATLLILGIDPSERMTYQKLFDDSFRPTSDDERERYLRPAGYEAIAQALTQALLKGNITGEHHPCCWHNQEESGDIEGTTDEKKSIVEFESLTIWLKQKEHYPDFFFPKGNNTHETTENSHDRPISSLPSVLQIPDYLQSEHPCYAPKLAVAIKAWQAVTESQEVLKRKTPKKDLDKWLKKNAADFGLIKENGKTNANGIEEIAKVANWNPAGGAPSTP